MAMPVGHAYGGSVLKGEISGNGMHSSIRTTCLDDDARHPWVLDFTTRHKTNGASPSWVEFEK